MISQSWHDHLSLTTIHLSRFSAVDNGDLRDALMAMGAKDIFDSRIADLSGITKDLKKFGEPVDSWSFYPQS